MRDEGFHPRKIVHHKTQKQEQLESEHVFLKKEKNVYKPPIFGSSIVVFFGGTDFV